ncbi:butyrophilin subfamily 2 member A1-like [Hypanus sabinus]|uniref:butyrophilin subfamily 2 member A1-like n=1 Tax=Hypanus sabinus TaxID=79690 RepID=UPI0028C4F649|nr:butyrophilin subfamily 2 member A1-like [Hypanus sabinus]
MESSVLLPLLVLGFIHQVQTGQLEVACSRIPIMAQVSSHVVLECQVIPTMDLRDKEIRWTKDQTLVHLYRFRQDENDQQDPRFKGRTQLFKDQFQVGNVSLKLHGVELSDVGSYNCFVEVAPDNNHDSSVQLKVTSVGELPSINLYRYTSSGIELVCETQQWFPAPTVNWSDERKRTLPQVPQDIGRNSKGFFQVRSIVEVTADSGNSYSCQVQNTVINQNLTAEFYVPDEFFPWVSKWVTGFVLILLLLIGVVIGLFLFFRNLQMHIKNLEKRPTAKEYEELQREQRSLEDKLGTLHKDLGEIRILPKMAIKRIKRVAVSVTLNLEAAHPNLDVSPDLTIVSHVRQGIPAESSKGFGSISAVLGKEGFSSGRHFWEVEVERNSEWDLGVALDKTARQGEIPLSPDNGFWTIGCHEKEFRVNNSTNVQISIKPWVQEKIQVIGIYVNYSEGKVLFYDTETNSHLHTFEKCPFKGMILFPFFHLPKKGVSLKICKVAPSA